jgi:hypothetical protein
VLPAVNSIALLSVSLSAENPVIAAMDVPPGKSPLLEC